MFFNPSWNPPLHIFPTWYMIISQDLVFQGKRPNITSNAFANPHWQWFSPSYIAELRCQRVAFTQSECRGGRQGWGHTASCCQRQVQCGALLSGSRHLLICPHIRCLWNLDVSLLSPHNLWERWAGVEGSEEFLIHAASQPFMGR